MSGLNTSMTESQGTVRRLSAGVMGLAGFAVALLAGLQAGNETSRIIVVALIAMLVCHAAGVVLGLVIERIVDEHKRTLNAIDSRQKAGTNPEGATKAAQPPRLAA